MVLKDKAIPVVLGVCIFNFEVLNDVDNALKYSFFFSQIIKMHIHTQCFHIHTKCFDYPSNALVFDWMTPDNLLDAGKQSPKRHSHIFQYNDVVISTRVLEYRQCHDITLTHFSPVST